MMTSQRLQIAPSEDSLARLRIITNGIVIVNIVFRDCVTGRRSLPVRVQSRADLLFLHGPLHLWLCFHVPSPCEMKSTSNPSEILTRLMLTLSIGARCT